VFTGIILESAPILQFSEQDNGLWRLRVESARTESSTWPLGSSVCLDGVCLTLVASNRRGAGCELDFELSRETLSRSTFGISKRVGSLVHLEPSLTPQSLMGGHFVSGHVDAVGVCESVDRDPAAWTVRFSIGGESRERVAPFLVEKGCIAVDGVSLTVNEVADLGQRTEFSCVLIPHTLNVTKFGTLQPKVEVNLEADLVAKYVARYQRFPFASST
jgi:riboflavin synthase